MAQLPVANDIQASVDSINAEIFEVLRDAKVLARRYYRLTGKPLGITGEVAEYEAATKLGLDLHCARKAGYDATEIRNGCPVHIQIKGRCVVNPARIVGRLGSIDLAQPFDAVLLVLLDSDFNAFAMYEASRYAVVAALTKPGSRARNERGSLGIRQFMAISSQRWLRQ
ncbi:hypothetical protein [Pseudomonas marvdashtae]|uniref:hypothetical protein n=1 Tax=Pseudomonas marvdashtae TaxID=2745500 RepID=UPI001672EFBD|nr:hypothetical protein [Pseudomonas marvdashtae]